MKAVDDAKKAAIQSVDDAKQAALNKVNAIIEDIKAIPSRTVAAVNRKLKDLNQEIQKLPGKISSSFQIFVENKKKQTQKAFEQRVEELRSSFPFSIIFKNTEVTSGQKVEVKVESPKPKVEARTEAKVEAKAEPPKPKVEAKAEPPKPKVETKAEPPKPKVEAKVEPPKPKVEAKVEPSTLKPENSLKPLLSGFSDLFGKQSSKSADVSIPASTKKSTDVEKGEKAVTITASTPSKGFSIPSFSLPNGGKPSNPVAASPTSSKIDTKSAAPTKVSSAASQTTDVLEKPSLKLEIPKIPIPGLGPKEERVTTSDIAAVVKSASEKSSAKPNPSPTLGQKVANTPAVKAPPKPAATSASSPKTDAKPPSATTKPSNEEGKPLLKLEIPKISIPGLGPKDEGVTTSDIAAVVKSASEKSSAKPNPSPTLGQKVAKTPTVKAPSKPAATSASSQDVDSKPMTSSSVLSSAAIKTLSAYPESVSLKVESSVKAYLNSEIPTEILYKDISSALGSKDKAFLVLPDIVGSLPRGDKKTALNSFYQNQA